VIARRNKLIVAVSRIDEPMTQESVALDYQNLIREPTTGFKLYVLFLIIVCIVTCTKLIKVWVAVPPFRASSKPPSPEYSALLRRSSSSLKHWIGTVILSYGLLFSTSLYGVCRDVVNDNRVGGAALFFVIEDYAVALSIALLVIWTVFLARWHLVRRIERLERLP
jgi:hypothetical protein